MIIFGLMHISSRYARLEHWQVVVLAIIAIFMFFSYISANQKKK